APILNNDGEIELVLELSVDELESRRLREELRMTRERFRQLFEESPCHIAVIDNEHRIQEANKAFKKTFGEPGGKQCYEVFAGSAARCEDCPMQATTNTGQVEKVVLDQQGRPLTMLVWTTPLRDTSGAVRECIEMSVDISELRQLQDRLSSLGLLMGSTAHGIKGMLTALDGTVYRIGSGIAKGDAVRIEDSLRDLRQMVSKLRKLVLDILYFSKERQLETSRIDPVELVRSVAATVTDRASESGVELEVKAEEDTGCLDADGAILHAALVNLVENAIDACRADSKTPHQVRLTVRRMQEQIEFRISDNGTGMPEEIRAKLFTLFFSSKGSGGTGIGLYVSRQIVLQHAGRIEVESTLGEGSTFIVSIPGALPC
ncbi:MAG: PAS domain-containing sensor histidine kinase, partial [Bilophila sp.]